MAEKGLNEMFVMFDQVWMEIQPLLKMQVLARGSKETVLVGVGQLRLASFSQVFTFPAEFLNGIFQFDLIHIFYCRVASSFVA